ncbi:MAG: hypothetical protein INR62_05710 [Rhodospirillales bacterium]|nr:hypothetical protein [Acetobacter sp.]
MEWLLVLTLHLSGPRGAIRDAAPSVVPGFTTEANCKAAAGAIADSLIRMLGKARERQGIQANTAESIPSINYECVMVRK